MIERFPLKSSHTKNPMGGMIGWVINRLISNDDGEIEGLFATRLININLEQSVKMLGVPITTETDQGWASIEIGIGYTF